MVSPLQRTESTFEEIPVMSEFKFFFYLILAENLLCGILVDSDIRDARSQDPVARRRLADLIRDACINVRPRSRYLIITFIK